jgi:hypothetical protein
MRFYPTPENKVKEMKGSPSLACRPWAEKRMCEV